MAKKILFNILNALGGIAVVLVASIVSNAVAEVIPNNYVAVLVNAVLYIGLALLLGLLYGKYVIKMNADELGVTFKKCNILLYVLGAALPFAILLLYTLIIPGTVTDTHSISGFAATYLAVFGVGITAGIVEEFVFRGIIFRYMKKTLGTKVAVIVPAVLFALLHIMNMETFDVLDLLLLVLAGSSVAVMFTMMALKSDCIWPGAFAHAAWNSLIIGGIFGIGGIVNGSENDSLIRIIPTSTSKLLTGGNFGVEAAITASIGYIIVAVLVYLFGGRKNKD